MALYVVKQGDTADEIAGRYGIDTGILAYDNQLTYPFPLVTGQALYIRDNGAEPSDAPLIRSNGYAYTFISRWVLEQTLPFLSELSIFSYGFSAEGNLIAPPLDDEWMIALAVSNGTLPILTLTPFGTDGKFNNQLIHAVVQDYSSRARLINELLYTMQRKGYRGLDIDFEFILAEDRNAFTEFVGLCTQTMNAAGMQVSVALAPKTSAQQPGLLYEGKDYKALGEAANHVLLMTYEWGYTYGPPMAVAPVNKVRQVVEYAVTEIASDKINLGIPNYGYDWPLPYEQGVTKAKTIGNIEAIQIALEYGVSIQFDETAQSPYFQYTWNNIMHEVWFEDVRSIQAKYNIIREFGLRGAGWWQIMQLFRANWLLLQDQFVISKT